MSEIDFNALFELSPNPYMVLDRSLRFVAANAAYRKVTSSRLDALLGRHILEVFPHDPADPNNPNARMLRESLERVVRTGSPDVLALIRYRIPREHQGTMRMEERIWSATHTPLKDARGEVTHILQHTVDVTELRALEQKAARAEAADPVYPAQLEAGVLGRAQSVQEANRVIEQERQHLLRLFEQAPGFLAFLRGPEHVFELANRAYDQLVGQRELVGKRVRDALPEIEGQGFFERLDRVFQKAEPFVGLGLRARLQRTPGAPPEERFLDLVYQPIIGPDGSVSGIFVQGHDITEQKRLETERGALLAREQAARAEAERANRLKDDFLATVSHELRTPLTAMLGWVQMLRSGRLAPEKRERALETVERNARAQSQLVEDLLDVSRIMSGKLQLQPETVEVATVAAAALESMRPAAEARALELEANLEPGLLVHGDPGRLQQVVWNLLSNAVKFSVPGGRVELAVHVVAEEVEVSVRDFGSGISPGFLPYVFERFRQAEGSTNRSHGGLGLGLAIVKQLVELHGGTVQVSSDGEGRGALFQLRLPLLSRASQLASGTPGPTAARPEQGFPMAQSLQGLRVLVVDDERETRELVRTLLESCGATVETAGSASEGFEAFTRVRPELLISDIGMPGEDGYSLIRKVRALPVTEGGRTPAVALTAYARSEDRTRALQAGFRAHVPKPIDAEELVAVLDSLWPAR